jgi:carbohydrate kinase (thermoresistant glucokinase family)
MGPSGCGKSTLAQALAARIGCHFLEGDDHHPPANIAKMAAGVPLTDADRWPFLDAIGRAILAAPRPVVVACSALRRAHRDRLRSYVPDIQFAWIDAPPGELERRARGRDGHFMPPSLLPDQIATLEPPAPPERFVRVEAGLPTAKQVQAIVSHMGRTGTGASPAAAIRPGGTAAPAGEFMQDL